MCPNQTPEVMTVETWVTDFQRCVGEASLKKILRGLDRLGYWLVAVSQDGDAYTVFFKRPVDDG